jgi:hypothetical protein
MKRVLAFLILFCQTVSQAHILKSDFEPLYQEQMAQAIFKSCSPAGILTQIGSRAILKSIDNGLEDFDYTTDVEVQYGIDQYLHENYTVRVQSELLAGYNPDTGMPATLVVKSVKSLNGDFCR